MENPHKRFTALFMTGAIAVASFFGLGAAYFGQDNNTATAAQKPQITDQQYQQVAAVQDKINTGSDLTIPEIAALAGGAVVEITTEQVSTDRIMGEFISKGAGSGVIIKNNGYIVTNNHVIEGANKITVRLKNGEEYEGKLIGQDSTTDLAIVKIDKKNLPSLIMGDSSKLIVGESAVAIGNPLGELGGTVTEGIISATDREISIDGEKMTLLQTTAAINPGNSGGALLNKKGELIGIVNAKSSGSDIEGLGFAIPINTAKDVVNSIINNGYVKGRVALGITLLDIADAQTAMSYMVTELGVYVVDVNNIRSPLKPGDRIISIDNKDITSSDQVKDIVKTHNVGDNLKFVVDRDGSKEKLTVKLSEKTN